MFLNFQYSSISVRRPAACFSHACDSWQLHVCSCIEAARFSVPAGFFDHWDHIHERSTHSHHNIVIIKSDIYGKYKCSHMETMEAVGIVERVFWRDIHEVMQCSKP